MPGHAVWVHDVFAFRGSPATWKEELIWVAEVSLRAPLPAERDGWRQLGDDPIVAALKPAEAADATIEVAALGEHLGSAASTGSGRSPATTHPRPTSSSSATSPHGGFSS